MLNKSEQTRRRRLPAKEDALADRMRMWIVEGRYAPGERLPVRRDLQRRLGLSCETVERVFRQLQDDAFIESCGRSGTFVAMRPPHLARVGVVFMDQAERIFMRAIRGRLDELSGETDLTFSVYCGMDGHRDTPDYERLREDCRRRRLAGVLFTHENACGFYASLCERAGIPYSVIASAGYEGQHAITLDYAAWRRKAFDRLQALGCRRVGVLTIPGDTPDLRDTAEMSGAIRARGMITCDAWVQAVQATYAHWAGHAVQAILQGSTAKRPDGLVITDDHLVEASLAAIRNLGLRLPLDLAVVAHCNYPDLPTVESQPIWLGFDARAVVHTALNHMRLGRAAGVKQMVVPAWFEEDWRMSGPGNRASVKTGPEQGWRGKRNKEE